MAAKFGSVMAMPMPSSDRLNTRPGHGRHGPKRRKKKKIAMLTNEPTRERHRPGQAVDQSL